MAENELSLIDADDLSLAGDNNLNDKQLKQLLKKTPPQYVKTRPAKGGGQWEYVTGGYVKKVLNLMFGWDWDFEIIEDKILHGEVIVKGKLTCRTNGRVLVKMQYGNKDIIYKKAVKEGEERQPLSIGNDLKAAATDALKKCAAEIGIAADIYNKQDFKEIQVEVNEIDYDELCELFELKKDLLSPLGLENDMRILRDKEVRSYKKLHDKLAAL